MRSLHRLMGISRLTAFYVFLIFAIPGVAMAAGPGDLPSPTLPLPSDMVWSLLASGLVPLGGYLINHYGPHTSEKVKGLVIALLGAVASGVAQAVTAGHVGLNNITLQYVLAGVGAAFAAHKFIWQPTTIAAAFGAGTNKTDQVPGPQQAPPV